MATSILALQKPKDISVDEIEAELRNIWRTQDDGGTAPVATRATTFTMVIYEPEEIQQLLATLGFYSGTIDGSHGPKTREAILEAQKAYEFRMTGRVDPGTLAKLREEVGDKATQKQSFTNSDTRGFSFDGALAAQNPCRVITLCPIFGEDEGVSAQVSAYCPVQTSNSSNLVCCEYITLRGTKAALERVADVVNSLVVSDLPKFVWWKASP